MDADWQSAAESGEADGLKVLLDAGADVDAKDRYGQTALMLAARGGHLSAVRVLLEHSPGLDHTAKFHLSAVMLAAINGHLGIVEALVSAGANVRLEGGGAPGFAGKTALDLAEDMKRDEIAELLKRHLE